MRRATIFVMSPLMITALLIFVVAQAEENSMNNATKALDSLFTSEWDYQMQHSPVRASLLGDRRWNDRWPDLTFAAIRERQEHSREVLARLRMINRPQLASRDQLNYDLFKKEYETKIEQDQFHWYLVPLNQREGIQTTDELGDRLRFETVKDYEDWTSRLRSFPSLMDQTIALMREAIRERMMLPKVIVQRIPAQIDKQIVADPEASPFYKPFKRFPHSVPEADRSRLAEAAREALNAGVIPAFKRFKQFIGEEYLPVSFDQVGVWQMPRGEEMYRFFVRRYTTTHMTPEQIHQIGLHEVQRIRAEMRAVIEETGFKGRLDEFFKFLRTDPRFYSKTPEELLTAYRATAKRIDPNLVKLFKTLPRMPYGVEPIPAIVAPDTTAAYYAPPAADGSRAGTFFVNLYKPESRPKWEMMALALHEAVPGHHVHIALEMEQGSLPNFRRFGAHSTYTAFTEGWGLYAESLGEDMGLYDDPYSKFGRLTYDMWRAVRLVVDTGIHLLRWDREKAIQFFMENAPRPELDVTNEVDRYIAWPGQALAYKIGELKIRELRARTSRALGEKFDVREFHSVLLGSGAVPLDVLEQNVTGWVEAKKR